MLKLSVILCSYNPRADYLNRTLEALRSQTLSAADWELVIVDNNSTPGIASHAELRDLPARITVEPNQGFTPALLRGLGEIRSQLCISLHDDNVLPSNYLEDTLEIAARWPQLGAWGGGYEPEFEEPPAAGLESLLTYLAIHPIEKDRWSNALYDYGATPCGAGMAVRTSVLRDWARLTREDPNRRALGRHTDKLTSCEDFDIAFTAIDMGFGTGVFRHLKIKHLIPRRRVQRDYLLRLVEGHGYSSVFLHSFRGAVTPPSSGLLKRLRHWRYRRALSPSKREELEALSRGEARAHAALAGQDGANA